MNTSVAICSRQRGIEVYMSTHSKTSIRICTRQIDIEVFKCSIHKGQQRTARIVWRRYDKRMNICGSCSCTCVADVHSLHTLMNMCGWCPFSCRNMNFCGCTHAHRSQNIACRDRRMKARMNVWYGGAITHLAIAHLAYHTSLQHILHTTPCYSTPCILCIHIPRRVLMIQHTPTAPSIAFKRSYLRCICTWDVYPHTYIPTYLHAYICMLLWVQRYTFIDTYVSVEGKHMFDRWRPLMHACLWVCIHIHMLACVFVGVYTHTYACMRVCGCVYTYICLHACLWVCIHIHMLACIYEHQSCAQVAEEALIDAAQGAHVCINAHTLYVHSYLYICICLFMCVHYASMHTRWIYTRVNMCICLYICIYLHTYQGAHVFMNPYPHAHTMLYIRIYTLIRVCIWWWWWSLPDVGLKA